MGERIFEQDAVCLAAVEAVYATDIAPTAATNAMQVEADMNLTDGDSEALVYDAGRGGNKGSLQVSQRITGSLKGYIAGSGTVDVPPAIAPLLQMAGLEPTITAATNVVYTPKSSDHDSGTVHIFAGKNKHPAVGARCDFELSVTLGATVKFTCGSFIGLYVPPTDAGSFQNANFSTFRNPLIADSVSITTMTLLGQLVEMSDLMFKQGNEVKHIIVTNNETVEIVGRKPTVELTIVEPLISDYNWFEQKNAYGALALQIGTDVTDAGDIFELDIPNLQISKIDKTTKDGIAYLKLTCDVVPTARDNDFSLTFR